MLFIIILVIAAIVTLTIGMFIYDAHTYIDFVGIVILIFLSLLLILAIIMLIKL